jgi:ribokinase
VKPIVVVGSINADLVARAARIPTPGQTVRGSLFRTFPGGKGANQAIGAAKLNYPTILIGKVGNDQFGEDLTANLVLAGVDCRAVEHGTSSTGVALIVTEESGENTIVIVGGANDELTPDDIGRHSKLIQSAGMLMVQLEVPMPVVTAACHCASAHGVPIMLDPAPAGSLPDTLIETLTWLTPNETEIGPLLGTTNPELDYENVRQQAEELMARGAQNVAVKLGARGSYLATREGLRAAIPAFRVTAVDSTAAGDAYNAGLAVALLRGMPPLEAVRYASAAAALSVTRHGAQPSMATAEELDGFLANNSDTERRGIS